MRSEIGSARHLRCRIIAHLTMAMLIDLLKLCLHVVVNIVYVFVFAGNLSENIYGYPGSVIFHIAL